MFWFPCFAETNSMLMLAVSFQLYCMTYSAGIAKPSDFPNSSEIANDANYSYLS
ncbi:MAG: hypothetical protein LBC02_03005 [Planctomycetaceae bacterium]|nr:hypothetical protein [Planctomycetaceae bacterium]